ncbi:hypothetical protein G9X67_34760 [Rhizobium sp. WYCCWR 11152]|uniref:hypothetical protein n=1 Tax=Rhizobium sp. WYCCWR 11152 TaxID=2692316 RepID=UPI001492454E|nr:hypothetical protein [Rhizobium sp. WYCCWR 11152]NNU70415.1 hypothetical protein [Rhizobium sp. WYCCWR 11152]
MSKSIVRVTCGHPGCNEFARYEADNRKHSIDLYVRYGNGKWKCVRHSQPDEVLSSDNCKTVDEVKVIKHSQGLYWGKEKGFSGFAHGPGFKAFAKDFPPGTILRVTAEIIAPPHRHAQESGHE